MCFYHINCCCPTVADDMVLISFSKAALEKMLRICFGYALKWGYEYNAIKSSVIVFNGKLSNQLLPSRIWKLGEQEVPETSQYKHLGIPIERDMTLNTVTKEASTKLKTTFLSLVNCGLREDGFTPLTAKLIYKSIVLPKSLYGCEVWSQLSPTQLSPLERAHRFCGVFFFKLFRFLQAVTRYCIIFYNPPPPPPQIRNTILE